MLQFKSRRIPERIDMHAQPTSNIFTGSLRVMQTGSHFCVYVTAFKRNKTAFLLNEACASHG
jgi:hypothetical protein